MGIFDKGSIENEKAVKEEHHQKITDTDVVLDLTQQVYRMPSSMEFLPISEFLTQMEKLPEDVEINK